MNICSYGCDTTALYVLKNGKFCCSKNYASCPAVKERNSNSNKKKAKRGIRENFKFPNVSCQFCNKVIPSPAKKRHEKYCYLNPYNVTLCPVCSNPIKDYRNTTTCSTKCANVYFRENSEIYKDCNGFLSKVDRGYRETCFKFHERKCVICEEKNLLDVHHFDKNPNNNDPLNLIPMCPTHHKYAHTKFYSLIKDKIDEYIKFKKQSLP